MFSRMNTSSGLHGRSTRRVLRASVGSVLPFASFALCALLACTGSPHGSPTNTLPRGPTQVMMSFDRTAGFYSAPFPSDDLRAADGTIDLSGFPNPNSADLITSAVSLASTTGGFGRSAGIFFQTTAALDPT